MESSFIKPSATATVVIYDPKSNKVVLVQRAKAPYRGYFAFPGGFVDTHKENTEQAARREVLEETAIDITKQKLQLIDVRSDPDRDPRDHVIDVGYFCSYTDIAGSGTPSSDAAALLWVNVEDVQKMILAFDHIHLLNSALSTIKQCRAKKN